MTAKPPEYIPTAPPAAPTGTTWRWLSFGLLLLSACRADDTRAPEAASVPAEPVHVALDTPENAARSVLTCLLTLRLARATGDDLTVRRCEEQLLDMAARDTILQRHHSVTRRAPRDPEIILARFVRNWSSLVGYYADQLDLDQITLAGPPPETDRADVHVPAVSAQDQTTLRIECVRGASGLWHVARIDFVATGKSQPGTRPAP